MTQADKTDILNLIASAKSLEKVAKDANEPYHDEAVADFARAAMDDAKEVNDFVLKTVQENIHHFVDLSAIRIGGGFWGHDDIHMFNKKSQVVVSIGKNLYAKLLVGVFTQRMDKPHTWEEVWIKVEPSDIEVLEVYNDTSDTSLTFADWEYSKETIYHVCRANDLFFNREDSYYLKGKYSPNDWKIIKARATWTRAKASLLVYSLKKSLVARVNGLRTTANEREETRANNGKTAPYRKVSL